jgi:hypothetical protein
MEAIQGKGLQGKSATLTLPVAARISHRVSKMELVSSRDVHKKYDRFWPRRGRSSSSSSSSSSSRRAGLTDRRQKHYGNYFFGETRIVSRWVGARGKKKDLQKHPQLTPIWQFPISKG